MPMTLQEQIDRALKALPKEPKRYLVVPKRPRPTGGKKRHAALKLKWHPTTTNAFYKKPFARGWRLPDHGVEVVSYAEHGNAYFMVSVDHNGLFDARVRDTNGSTVHWYGPFGTPRAAKVALEANFAYSLPPTGGKKRHAAKR